MRETELCRLKRDDALRKQKPIAQQRRCFARKAAQFRPVILRTDQICGIGSFQFAALAFLPKNGINRFSILFFEWNEN